jgi:hypothetical protein
MIETEDKKRDTSEVVEAIMRGEIVQIETLTVQDREDIINYVKWGRSFLGDTKSMEKLEDFKRVLDLIE